MAGEELTKEVFGDYVSVYNFKESVDDVNTVPLYYENRIPELQLTNDNLTEEIAEICDRAELDDDQERKLEREFAREYHLITREDRLERVGDDIVVHYMGRRSCQGDGDLDRQGHGCSDIRSGAQALEESDCAIAGGSCGG
jgi:type I restriction enzyme R subunit